MPATPERRSSRIPDRTGGNGREQGVEQRVADAVPPRDHPQPGLAVAGVVLRRAPPRCRPASAAQHGTTARRGSAWAMTSGAWRQASPCSLEVQVADDRAGGGQRVERAEQVGDEPGLDALGTAHGPAHLVLGLDEHDVPAGIGEGVGGDQAVGPGAHHHGVAGRSPASALLRVARRVPRDGATPAYPHGGTTTPVFACRGAG